MATMNNIQINALYDDDDILLKGVKAIREKGLEIGEVYSPFPIHGLDHAMGLKGTRIAIAAFLYGLLGLTVAVTLTMGTMIIDWPMNIGGKPSFSYGENMPAFVPIIFELTVFFSAHLLVWTFFFRNKLFPGQKAQNPDPRTTDDKFLMEVQLAQDSDQEEIINLLKESGAIEVSLKKDENA